MLLKGKSPLGSCPVIRLRLSAHKGFFNCNIFQLFQCPQVSRKISITYLHHFFETIEIKSLISHQNRHHLKSNNIFECFVVFPLHLNARICNTSNLHIQYEGLRNLKPKARARNLEKMLPEVL